MADNTGNTSSLAEEGMQQGGSSLSGDESLISHPVETSGEICWESPLKLAPKAKKVRLSVDFKKCAVCQKSRLGDKIVKATATGVKTMIAAAAIRKDDFFTSLVTEYGDIHQITSDTVDIYYHRKCMQTYTSKSNLAHVRQSSQASQPATESSFSDECVAGPSHFSRAYMSAVDWQSCIICSKKSHKKDHRLLKLQTKDREARLKEAAKLKNDEQMLFKILAEDLIARDTVYHSACFSTYVRTLPVDKDIGEYEHSVAFKKLIAEIDNDLRINKRAFLLSTLLEMYKVHLPNDSSYKTAKLQRKLENHYGESISVQRQRGQGSSNVVMSSDISLGDAIRAMGVLKKEMKVSQLELDINSSTSDDDPEHILYRAAAILRNDIASYAVPLEYPSPKQMSLSESKNQMPPLISQFVEWLVDKNAFASVGSNYVSPDDVLRKCVSLTECIVSSSQKMETPLQIGLAIQLHHEYGSRNLIDTLHSHGFCVSYDELRRFITSVAEVELSRLKDQTYVPSGIIPVSNGGSLVQEGDDNVDINAETIDGKDTFHSMARVVFQQQNPGATDASLVSVKRGQKKSLPLNEEVDSLMQCLPFNKPKVRAEPPRVDEAKTKIKLSQRTTIHVSDITWVILRSIPHDVIPLPPVYKHENAQVIPFWTGYNSLLSESNTTYTAVAYAPIIDEKPSDMSTVYTTMKRCKDMCSSLGQSFSVQTMDQQLYAVAQQVKWSAKDEFSEHVIRLGGFHSLCCYIAAIGKLWADGGLRDLLVDSDVYAGCTVDQMLSGKQFNRSVRGLILAYEAMAELWLSSFFKWCELEGKIQAVPAVVWQQIIKTQKLIKEGNAEVHEAVREMDKLVSDHLEPLFCQFRSWGYSRSPTFEYWDMFLKAVQIMLDNIRAERVGDWQGHLHSQSNMLPYFFTTDRTNYSRWMPVYLLDMLSLPEEISEQFKMGHFAIRQKPGKFNGIWSDLGVEKTVIRDSKGSGGIVGLTRKKAAMVRWSLTRHILGGYASAMKDRSGQGVTDRHQHEETYPAAMKRDEEHLNALTSHLRDKMTDPFDVTSHPEVLVNISTGVLATAEIQQSLLHATDTGQKKMEKFVEASLSSGQNQSFYSPIARSKLKTFADMNKKTKIKLLGGRDVTLQVNISPELVFRRALTLAKNRDGVTVSSVLSHPIGPVPTGLFHDDGTMRKCTKAELGHKLEELTSKQAELPDYHPLSTVFIKDAMATIQAINGNRFKTFGDLAYEYMASLAREFNKAATVIDVFDRYDNENSVKAGERERRASSIGGPQKEYDVIEGRAVPQWKRFLSVAKNKQSLVKFLCDYVVKNIPTALKQRRHWKLIIAGGLKNPTEAKCMTAEGLQDMPQLQSNHEEADTRMILHAMAANREFGCSGLQGRIIIRSPDTDVLVLAVHYFPQMLSTKELWIQTGTVTNTADHRRFIPVHSICHATSPTLCQILPAAHALTGCDSTSAMFGIGKRSVFKIIHENAEKFSELTALNSQDDIAAISAARKLTLSLYDPKEKSANSSTDLNQLRVKLASRRNASLIKLPPCEASFLQHVKRASWQTKIWMASHIAMQDIGSP